jgi:hypothetical protein
MRTFGRLEGRALRARSEESGVALRLPPQSKRGPAFLDNFHVIPCVSWAGIPEVYPCSSAGL